MWSYKRWFKVVRKRRAVDKFFLLSKSRRDVAWMIWEERFEGWALKCWVIIYFCGFFLQLCDLLEYWFFNFGRLLIHLIFLFILNFIEPVLDMILMLILNKVFLVIFLEIVQIVFWGKWKPVPSAHIELLDAFLMESFVEGVSQSKEFSVFGASGRHGLTDR